jgi:hypothetical protein
MKHAGNLICDTDVIRNCGVISQLPLNILEFCSAIKFDEERIYIGINNKFRILLLKFHGFTYLIEKDLFLKSRSKIKDISVSKLSRYSDNFYAVLVDTLVRFQTDIYEPSPSVIKENRRVIPAEVIYTNLPTKSKIFDYHVSPKHLLILLQTNAIVVLDN